MAKTKTTKRKVRIKDSSKENANTQKKNFTRRNQSKTIVLHSTSGKNSVTRKISQAAFSKWRELSQPSKNYCLQLMDYGIHLVLSRINDNVFNDIQSHLVSTRRSFVRKLEVKVGPVNKVKDFKNLSKTLIKLTDMDKKLNEQLLLLENAIQHEESLCTEMEQEIETLASYTEDTQLHPLLQQPYEEQLHLSSYK